MKKRGWTGIAAALAASAAIFGTTAPLQACEGHDHHSRNGGGTAISKKAAISFGGKTYRASFQPLTTVNLARVKHEPSKK